MAPGRSKASLQTFHALQASDLASAMNEAMKKIRIAPGDYGPELTAPEGPSTGGGVQAMQHLRLVSSDASQPALVVGHANHAAKSAELRTFEYVEAVHRERFQRPPAIERAQYDDFLHFAQTLFTSLHLQTTVVGPPASLAPARPASIVPPALSIRLLLIVGAASSVVIALAAWLLFR